MLDKIITALEDLHKINPLIHQITNYVTVNDCANITLAIGALPVMSQDICEVAEMVTHAKALVINIGTLESNNIEGMFIAASRAKELSIPIVFDPVGVGATSYRTTVAKRFINEICPNIIRCNMSELKILCGMDTLVKGVDSVAETSGGEMAAKQLAAKIDGIVAVTGKVDIITDSKQIIKIANGDLLLTKVTGTGCMTTALTACFAGVSNPFIGAVAGVACMGIAGEIAAKSLNQNEGIGTFKVRLMDAIFNLDSDTIKQRIKLVK